MREARSGERGTSERDKASTLITAIEPWTAVGLAYALVLLALAVIVIRSAQRGRRLSDQVPEEQRRWM